MVNLEPKKENSANLNGNTILRAFHSGRPKPKKEKPDNNLINLRHRRKKKSKKTTNNSNKTNVNNTIQSEQHSVTAETPVDNTNIEDSPEVDASTNTTDTPVISLSSQNQGESYLQNAIRMTLLMRKGFWNVKLSEIENNRNYKNSLFTIKEEAKNYNLDPNANAIDSSLLAFISENLFKNIDHNDKITLYYNRILKLKRDYSNFKENKEFWNHYVSFKEIAVNKTFKKTVHWYMVKYAARKYTHISESSSIDWELVDKKFLSKSGDQKYYHILFHIQKRYQQFIRKEMKNTLSSDSEISNDIPEANDDTSKVISESPVTSDVTPIPTITDTPQIAESTPAAVDPISSNNSQTEATVATTPTTSEVTIPAADVSEESNVTPPVDVIPTETETSTEEINVTPTVTEVTNTTDISSAQTSAISMIRRNPKHFCTNECVSICKDKYKIESQFLFCAKNACLCQNSQEILSGKNKTLFSYNKSHWQLLYLQIIPIYSG